MTLYEINQNGYKSLSNMIPSDITKATKDLAAKIDESKGNYYMLLCKELSYYTIFTWKKAIHPFDMAEEVVSIAKELGNLKGIDVQDDCTKIWIEKDDECHAYLFFNYTEGVIEV